LYGDTLPRDSLSEEELEIYERLYGPPMNLTDGSVLARNENGTIAEEQEVDSEVMLLKEGSDGDLEEVEVEEGLLDNEEILAQLQHAGSEDVIAEDITEYRARMQQEFQSGKYTADALRQEEQFLQRDEDGHLIARSREQLEEEEDDEEDYDDFMRTHPLTNIGKFGTSPSTIQLPKETLVGPVTSLLAAVNKKHLSEVSHRIFGGPGLPDSPATPVRGRSLEQRPIPLNASQHRMSDMDGDVHIATVMPSTYAAITSTLVEVRKRLGATWLHDLMAKPDGARVLDAGAGGAGVLAWRDILSAEWEVLHDGSRKPPPVPFGRATVLTGSDALRHRASRLLDNTTFLPRLPDYVHVSDADSAQRKKFDVIIAPHTLWGIKEEYLRKQHVQNLWSMLDPAGGVLVLLEKGVPRGFEVVASARKMLLKWHIASPGAEEYETDIDAPAQVTTGRFARKEKGMIVAPCTNHVGCPMFKSGGVSKGRKDYCYFTQRFIRPPYLQHILGAKERNHDDVQFSYLAVMRGEDLRAQEDGQEGVKQGEEATDAAFEGFEDVDAGRELGKGKTGPVVDPLSLPRALYQPMKRRGHVLLDVCTPSGTFERWTVPRSWSKQAYRDARKSKWGDLWALGAKTRVARNVRLGLGEEERGGVETAGGMKEPRRRKGSLINVKGGGKVGRRERAKVREKWGRRNKNGKQGVVVREVD